MQVWEIAGPALLSAGGFAAFVAATGAAVVWARFYAATLPADQSVDALPNGELIVTGAFALALFMVLGVLAVVIVYIAEPTPDASGRLTRGLLLLFALEGLAVIGLEDAHFDERAWGAVVLAAGVGASYWINHSRLFAREVTAGDRTRHVLNRTGGILQLLVAGGTVAGVSLTLHEDWVGYTLAVAAGLAMINFRLANALREFPKYAVAVFASVPLLGAVASITRSIEDPEVQPVAVIRAGDKPNSGLQGIYVAENDSRVYIGIVRARDCAREELLRGGGRIMWVPKKDVVAMSIGAPQAPNDAARQAPRLLEELTATRLPTPRRGPAQALTQPIEPGPRVRFDAPEDGTFELGERTDVTGDFGRRPGTVSVGGRPAQDVVWGKDRIRFTIPRDAAGGSVTVSCPPLPGATELPLEYK